MAVFTTAKRFRSSRDSWSSGSHQCPQNSFVWVQFTTKSEPTANDLLVLVKTRSQRNAVVQPLAARLGITLLFLPSPTL